MDLGSVGDAEKRREDKEWHFVGYHVPWEDDVPAASVGEVRDVP